MTFNWAPYEGEIGEGEIHGEKAYLVLLFGAKAAGALERLQNRYQEAMSWLEPEE